MAHRMNRCGSKVNSMTRLLDQVLSLVTSAISRYYEFYGAILRATDFWLSHFADSLRCRGAVTDICSALALTRGMMDDTDDRRPRSRPNSILVNTSRSAFRSEHSFHRSTTADDDHELLVRAAMEEAENHPERHRMAVIPSKSRKKLALVDVHKLTTSKKRLVLSRAMETSGQDNERLLTKIRDRQDRCRT